MDNNKKYLDFPVFNPKPEGESYDVLSLPGLRGYRTHRLVRDDSFYETEVKLSDEFSQLDHSYPTQLEDMIYGHDQRRMTLNKHEMRIMATTIQWLGTPVGMSFLRKCGFDKIPDAEK